MIWLILTILGGVLYRLGGAAGYNTKYRDLGLPLVSTLYLLTLGLKSHLWGLFGLVGAYFLTFGLFFGALTMSYKKKGLPGTWKTWLLMGLGYSLSFLPFAVVFGLWLEFVLRCVICSILIMIWRTLISNDVWEEVGTGIITIGTLIIF